MSGRVVSATIAGVAVTGLLALMAWGMLPREPLTARSGITRVGQPAPDFTLGVLDAEEELTLSDYSGTPLVLNVWASWCPPCRIELPLLERGSNEYADSGVQFIGLNVQDTEADAISTVRRYGLRYPNVRDPRGRSVVDWGVVGLPVTFFIDRDGFVVRRAVGALTPELLAVAVGDLLADTTPRDNSELFNPDQYYELQGS